MSWAVFRRDRCSSTSVAGSMAAYITRSPTANQSPSRVLDRYLTQHRRWRLPGPARRASISTRLQLYRRFLRLMGPCYRIQPQTPRTRRLRAAHSRSNLLKTFTSPPGHLLLVLGEHQLQEATPATPASMARTLNAFRKDTGTRKFRSTNVSLGRWPWCAERSIARRIGSPPACALFRFVLDRGGQCGISRSYPLADS